MNSRRGSLLRSASYPALAVLATATLFHAGPAGAQVAEEPVNAAEDSGQPIIVTGTRIIRPELSLPNPVQVLDAQTIEQSGQTNLTEFLADQPALLGSQTSNLSAGSELENSNLVGVNFLDLRNLGEDRTLVLVDGRRHVAGYPGSAAVDINTIPNDLVERVDVLTGGASAVYGADGVSGVVNFVMKRDFEGLQLHGQLNFSERGDAGSRFVAVTAGQNFADDRANLTLAYEYNETDRFSQRERLHYGRTGPSYALTGNPDDPADADDPNVPDRVLLTDLRWADSSPGGAVDLDGDGVPDRTGEGGIYDLGIYVPRSAFTIGGSSTPRESYYGDYTPYTRRHIANALASFEVSDALNLYAEGKYVRSTAYTYSQPTYDFFTTLYSDNFFLDQRYGPGAAPDGATFSRDNFDFGIRRSELERELIRGVVGANGEITGNISYDLSYVFGRSTQVSTDINDRFSDRYYAAIDAVADPATGQVTCRINLPGQTAIQYLTSNSTTYPNISEAVLDADDEVIGYLGPVRTFTPGECVPLNILGEGSPSQEALDWITVDHTGHSRITQHVVTGAISGDTAGFFELPGGPAGFAVGAEYRKESSVFNPSAEALAGTLDDTAQLRVDRGSFDVKEVFAEVNLPILSDRPFAEILNVGGAIRGSDYSTVGTTLTWKVEGTYSPVRDVMFRGTYSQAVRAPNINELFAGGSGSYEFIIDPCGIDRLAEGTQYRVANCSTALTALGIDPTTFNPDADQTSPQNSSIQGFQGGNPTLDEETATTWTAGVVLRPSFLPGLVLTADWYDISLTEAIQYSTAQDIADLCYDQPSLDNLYCSNLERSARTGYVSTFTVIPENVASFETSGLDVTLAYRFTPGDFGTFNVRLAGNYLNSLSFVPSAGADPEDELLNWEYPAPRYSGTFDLTWQKGPLEINYGINYFSKTQRITEEQLQGAADYAPAEYFFYRPKWEHEIYASYDTDEGYEIYGGINNLFDRKPDDGAIAYPISAVGRSFFVGMRAKIF